MLLERKAMTNEKISIIVPTYNREDFILEAVNSVLAQTVTNWELIIVDDGSTDDTYTVLEPLLKDNRIIYQKQENQGQAVARQQALKIAKGSYIAFLDSDNRWLPNRLELGLKALKDNPQASISYGNIITIDENGEEVTRENMLRHSGAIAPLLLRDNFVAMNTTLVRKSAIDKIGGMRGEVRRGDDYDLWLRLSAEHEFIYIPEFMADYRVMDDQISSNKDGRFVSNRAIVENFHRQYPHAVTVGERRRSWSAFFVRKAAYEASMQRKGQALSDVVSSIWQQPFWQGPWRVLAKMALGRY